MNAILENLLAPLVRRIGTAAAVWLLAKGLPSDAVEPLVNNLVAIVLLGIDLLLARFYRKSVVIRTVAALGATGFNVSRLAREAD